MYYNQITIKIITSVIEIIIMSKLQTIFNRALLSSSQLSSTPQQWQWTCWRSQSKYNALQRKCNKSYKSSSNTLLSGNSSTVIDGLAASSDWRKIQLSKVTEKFRKKGEEVELDTSPVSNTDDYTNNELNSKIQKGSFVIDETKKPLEINNDEDVQPMWKDMESRVTRRKTITVQEAKIRGKSIGRRNIRKTDEEAWMDAGLYLDEKER